MAKKYKKPENTKHKPRKDLKDYTADKDVENMVPNATGELQPGPRKDDKEVITDVENMVPKTKDSDRMYPIKDLEDGDPKMAKHAQKTFDKNIEEDAKEFIETMSKKDGGYTSQIKKLTKEQKEKLVREIVKRKVKKFIFEEGLKEQPKDEDKPLADTPEPPPAPDAPAIPADTPAPAPDAPAPEPAPPAEPPAPAEEPEPEPAPEEPAPEDPTPEDQVGSEEDPDGDGVPGDARIRNFVVAVQQKPNIIQQIKMIMQVVTQITADDDRKQKIGKLGLLKRVVDRSLQKL